ncbi:uncharacterized protein AB675_440 [Cyphellophora attinorum]|uniref:NAD-dependent epimerase/dehydratase domain-containing protein n=1 Tax=Cyphellophora attinorum TaxID=1664694 RepID=A0A0N1P4E8_9EURO|nr:uncharacterized protein AB675_440 [Phialophora attinorum]KPI45654.1 hypothetical protein AB675_440 [Phialophora attinorum]
MPPSILLTGASGYLGGTILSQLLNPHGTKAILSRSAYNKIYCLVRNDVQADSLNKWVAASSKAGKHQDGGGIEPIMFDYLNIDEAERTLREKGISVVFYLIDAFSDKGQRPLIEALGKVKSLVGGDVHFLHTTGAKIFSSHTGTPIDRPLHDDDPELYEIQKKSKAPLDKMQVPVDTNNTVIELCEKYGVKSYIFAPCIVYGRGEGFGNPISIQTKAIVQCAKALRRVYAVDEGEPSWPVCHVVDTASLYLFILSAILSGSNLPSGKQGYYLASPGVVKWIDLYRSMAKHLLKAGVIDTDEVVLADEKILEEMAKALQCEPSFVGVQVGGMCTFQARNGQKIGWAPEFKAKHALAEGAEEEVKLLLANMK